jgi:hypothetical protein
MARRDGLKFETDIVQPYFENALGIKLSKQNLTLDIRGQQIKQEVDLVSEDQSVLIACKSHTWRRGHDPVPRGKLDDAKKDALFLNLLPQGTVKIMVIDDDMHPKKGSLASYFERWARKQGWLGDVQVWRHWQGTFEKLPIAA